MPVRAATRHETEVIDKRREPRDILARVARVAHLDTVHPISNECFHSLARSALRRMRENGEAAGAMNQRDRVNDGEALFRDVGRTTIPEIAIEGVAEVDGPAFGDHGARDVWSADRAARRLFEHRAQVDTNSELVEPLDDSLGARASHVAQRDECRFHLTGIGEMKAENVRFDVTLDGAQLDAGNDTKPVRCAGARRLLDTGDGIVIGECDRLQAGPLRRGDDVGRRTRSVGRGGVNVKIDESAGRWPRGLDRRHAE